MAGKRWTTVEIIFRSWEAAGKLRAANAKLREALNLIIIDADDAEAWSGLSGERVSDKLKSIIKKAKQALAEKKGE